MNSSHIIATGGITAMLAGVLLWATRWPLQPLDSQTALDLAGLIVAIGAGVLALCRAWLGKHGYALPPLAAMTPDPTGTRLHL